MNITVYLGSCEGNDPAMKTAVAELGRWIGESGNRLVYGGSKTGLMGLLADSVLSAGGEVTGVELEMFMEAGYQHTGLTELIVKPDFDPAGGCVHRFSRRHGHPGGDQRDHVLGSAEADQGPLCPV